jgi:hypothetical protein
MKSNEWRENRKSIALIGVCSALMVLLVAKITPGCSWQEFIPWAMVVGAGICTLGGCCCAIPEELARQQETRDALKN